MLINVFKFIGIKLKLANTFVNNYSVNAIQLPSGEIIEIDKIKYGDAIGIDDSLGNSFYIKIANNFSYLSEKNLSSSQKEYKVSVPFKMVFFSPVENNNFSPLQLEQKFVNDFRNMTFSDYLGEERKIRVQVRKSNINSISVFEEETKIKYRSDSEMKIIAIEGDLIYLSSNECNCDCGSSTNTDIINSYDFCKPEIFALLSATQKACLTEALELEEKLYKEIAFTGVIDNLNTIFSCAVPIVQIFKDSALLFKDVDYTLSGGGLVATLLVAPNPAYGNALKFFGNI